jgi:hypothetical protein
MQKMGLVYGNEYTYAHISSVLTLAAKMKEPGDPTIELTDVYVLSEKLKSNIRADRDRIKLPHYGEITMYPNTAEEFAKEHPTLYLSVFGDEGAAKCPIDEASLGELRRGVPCRKSHHALTIRAPSLVSKRARQAIADSEDAEMHRMLPGLRIFGRRTAHEIPDPRLGQALVPHAGGPLGGGHFPHAGNPFGGGHFPHAGDPLGGGHLPHAGNPLGGGHFPHAGNPLGGGHLPHALFPLGGALGPHAGPLGGALVPPAEIPGEEAHVPPAAGPLGVGPEFPHAGGALGGGAFAHAHEAGSQLGPRAGEAPQPEGATSVEAPWPSSFSIRLIYIYIYIYYI